MRWLFLSSATEASQHPNADMVGCPPQGYWRVLQYRQAEPGDSVHKAEWRDVPLVRAE